MSRQKRKLWLNVYMWSGIFGILCLVYATTTIKTIKSPAPIVYPAKLGPASRVMVPPKSEPPPRKPFIPPYDALVDWKIAPLKDKSEANTTQTLKILSVGLSAILSEKPSQAITPEDSLSPSEQKIFALAKSHLSDGTLTLKLEMPGAVVAPETARLIGQPITFLIRPAENKDALLMALFRFNGKADQISFYPSGDPIVLEVEEHYSQRETVNWYYAFAGSGFTLTGVIGAARLLKKNDEKHGKDKNPNQEELVQCSLKGPDGAGKISVPSTKSRRERKHHEGKQRSKERR